MKKIILIAAMAIVSVAATAQNFKFGYVNYTEIIQLMPEMDSVRVQIEARFQESQQIFQQELQQMQQMLQAPVIEKAQLTITELAKANGLAFVFEETQMLYIDQAQGVNLTPEARKALNIPEGRTLETLQAELQAKAQAAQMQ